MDREMMSVLPAGARSSVLLRDEVNGIVHMPYRGPVSLLAFLVVIV